MPFQKMTAAKYPPRLWGLVGYPGSGKSTFAAAMRAPMLAIDADHRFAEVVKLVEGDVYELSDQAADNTNADRVAAILAKQMPGSDVATIVIDSLTAIITPLVVQAIVDKDAGREKNLWAAFRDKALAMRQLQDAVTKWGTDCLWIYHLNDARDAKGEALVKATVSQTELARLTRSINMQLEMVRDKGGKCGVKVVWARRGRSGLIVWDDTGCWRGMPGKIEAACYDGLTQADQDGIEGATPDVFPNAETAIAWAIDRKAFDNLPHARNAYEKLKREKKPASAREMAAMWVADVQARLLTTVASHDGDSPEPEPTPEPQPEPQPQPAHPAEEARICEHAALLAEGQTEMFADDPLVQEAIKLGGHVVESSEGVAWTL